MRRGDLVAAEKLIEESIQISRDELPPDGLSHARNLEVLARWLIAAGREAEARPLLQEVLIVYQNQLDPGHASLAETMTLLGQLRE